MKTSRKNYLLGGTAAIALLLSSGNQALAQSETEANAEFELETIVVTARKREESIMDVPLSVTALSVEKLTAAGLDNIVDLANITPGLDFEAFNTLQGRQDSTPFIRGITVDAALPNPLAQPVGVFIDGIFVSGGTKAIGLDDIARVEVVRGPQSATYGRSTFAGAINYVTADPSEDFAARVAATMATRDEYELLGSIEGPLAGDVLSGRLSGRYNFNGGHFENTANPGEELGEEQTYSIGGILLFEPSDKWRTKIRTYYSKIDDGPAAVALIGGEFNNFGPSPAPGDPTGGVNGGDESIFAGTLPSRPDRPLGLNTTDADIAIIRGALEAGNFIPMRDDTLTNHFGLEIDTFRASIDSTYDFGNATLTGIAGYNYESSVNIIDNDQTTDQGFGVVNPREFEDISLELRLEGNGFNDKLYWALGANYYDARFDNNFAFVTYEDATPDNFNFADTNPAVGARITAETGISRDNVQNYGFSGQFAYDLTDRITISYEGRYNVDDIEDIGNLITDGAAADNPNLTSNEDTAEVLQSTFKNYLQRATIDYSLTENSLLYFTYSEGNLPGGFNATFAALTQEQVDFITENFGEVSDSFDEESLRNFEVGYKGSAFDNRLNFAVSGFMMDRNDEVVTTTVQAPDGEGGLISTTVTFNGQSTRVLGVEAEADWAVSEALVLNGTFAYIDSEVDDFPEGAIAGGDLVDVLGLTADPIGQKAPRFAKVRASFSAAYENPDTVSLFGGEWNTYGRADYFHTGSRFLTLLNVGETPGSNVVNLRLGLRSDSTTIEFFVTNLTNEDAPTAGNNTSDLSFTRFLLGPPGFASPGAFNFGLEATSIGLRDRRQFGIRLIQDF